MPLLPRFDPAQRIEDEAKLGKILLQVEAEGAHPDSNGRVYRRSADGHNRDRRRGLPVISKGITGTAPGTDPVDELLRKDARSALRR